MQNLGRETVSVGGSMTTKAEFVAHMERIGLSPEDHDCDALHAAFLRLTELCQYLDTTENRKDASTLFRFNPHDAV
jgi:hypothetical protein